jgi:hypothetical protein
MMSLNNKVICEPYTGGKGLKSEVKSGFASIKQKNSLVGLKVLVEATITVGSKIINIPAGSIAFFNEETLYLHQQYHNPIENEVLGQPFIIAESAHIIMVGNK